ncbi:MAG: hypothetical protein ACXVZ2_01800 [Gaiellaceae bacterium]
MDEWIQVGLTANAGDATSRIFYEVARPGRKPLYRELSHRVRLGEQHRFAVVELANRPNRWQARLDGSPVGAPVFLADSHGKWTAQVIGESAAGSGACNLYAYSFRYVSVASAGAARGARRPVPALPGPVLPALAQLLDELRRPQRESAGAGPGLVTLEDGNRTFRQPHVPCLSV